MKTPFRSDIDQSPCTPAGPSQTSPASLHEFSVNYIPHPLFARANAEQAVFGENGIAFALLPLRPANARKLLSQEEEKSLFIQFNYCRFRQAEATAAQRAGPSCDLRLREITLWRRAGLDRRDRLVECNLGLVPMMIRKLRANFADFDELASEGNLALLNAVDKFDIERGFRFSTYACQAIHHAMVQAIGRRYRRPWMSLDGGVSATAESNDAVDGAFDEETSQLSEIVRGNDANLTTMELQVIHSRFALPTTTSVNSQQDPMTREKIGRMVGLSKERIRQIEQNALAKIRRVLEELNAV